MNEVRIPAGRVTLDGNLTIVDAATAIVLFVHGSGSSRHSPRNQFVARTLNNAGLATLLFDLLTAEEEGIDARTAELRFNIELLGERLVHATKWAKQQEQTRNLRIGYFGSSTGGAAALVAAAELPQDAGAVVSRGGRPDLAGEALPKVQAPTLLIVGGRDDIVMIESEGITENVDPWRTDVPARLIDQLGLEKLMFEAADPDVFAWYIKNYGADVNLFVDHSQIVQLECLRAGIWGTKSLWGRVVTYRDTRE